ncbi:TPA: hydroxymethylglutaryl-CoA synthase, partial [Listeria innocua]
IETAPSDVQERLLENYRLSTLYSRNVGNIYTGSLYLSFISLLDNQANLQADDKIGFFSYGSGAVGEFFHGELQPDYKKYIRKEAHAELLANRTKLSIQDYETKFKKQLPKDGSTLEIDPASDPAPIILTGIQDHKRQYIKK